MGQDTNGHGYVDAMQRDVWQAAMWRALTDRLGLKFETAEARPGVVSFNATVGPVVSGAEASRFKMAQVGELEYTAAAAGVLCAQAIRTHFHSEATTFLAQWLGHTAACASQLDADADEEEVPAACSCGLDKVVVVAPAKTRIEVAGG